MHFFWSMRVRQTGRKEAVLKRYLANIGRA
jgi:hypothetical protein